MTLGQLVQWAKDNGAVISPHLSFELLAPNKYGCVLKDATEMDNSSLIRLPITLSITLSDAITSFNYGAYGDFETILTQTTNVNSLLKLFLCREASQPYVNKSKYQLYLELLPSLQAIDSPYCWNQEDKAYIKGTNLGNSLKDNLALLVEEWWQIINLLPSELPKPETHYVNMVFYYEYKFYSDQDLYEYFTKYDVDNWTAFPNYLWASLILKSRSFPAYLLKSRKSDKPDEAMLLPVVDLLNHEPTAKVEWVVNDEYFEFKSFSVCSGQELFNNYGRKGNEELLLAYGFCLENNDADTAAVRIKLDIDMLPDLEAKGIKIPRIQDYTTSVIQNNKPQTSSLGYEEHEEGLLFFISKYELPDNLLLLFQWLCKNPWETSLSIRMKFAGINQLRSALEQKLDILENIKLPVDDTNIHKNIQIYILGQKSIFSKAIKALKQLEKAMLVDQDIKPNLLSLKSVFKRDKPFADALLIGLGITSFEQLVEHQFQDQTWLLYLMRCHNKQEYPEDNESFIPEWIVEAFDKISNQYEITPQEIIQYRDLYESLIIPLTQTASNIFNKGNWTVNSLIYSAKLLDMVSFVRGKDKDCILVKP